MRVTADSDLLTTWLTVSPVDVVTPLGYRLVPDVEPIINDIVIIERAKAGSSTPSGAIDD